MKICETYDHHNATELISQKDGLMDEVNKILDASYLKFGSMRPKDIKSIIGEEFNRFGWADKVKVLRTNLTISFLKSQIGVCFQIGNVARTYADILKICHLQHNKIIEAGIMIVPHSIESRLMGTNYANYDRLTSELEEFKEIVSAPILVIGLSN